MKLYTGYFAKHGLYSQAYSIARRQPPGLGIPEILELAPSAKLLRRWQLRRITWGEYTTKYINQLERVGILQVESMLQDGMVLLCWERPDKDCHRHLLASWLRERWHDVEELS